MKKIRPVEYFIYLLFFLICIYTILKNKHFKTVEISTKFILFSFFIKIISGITLWYIFTYYYTENTVSDIYKYFEDGKHLALIFKQSPIDFFKILKGEIPKNTQILSNYYEMKFWIKPNSYGIYNDNQTIIILSSILNLITNNHLILSVLYISSISFFTTLILFKTLASYLQWKKLFFILLFFLPSIALWTSSLLKETITFCSLAVLIYFGNKLIYTLNLKNLIGFIIGGLALLISKTYLLGFITPSILCILFIKILKTVKIKLIFILSYTLIIFIVISWSINHNPITYNFNNKTKVEKKKEYDRVNQISYKKNVLGTNYNLLEMLRFKKADYKFEARLAHAKSLVNTKKLDGQLSNFFLCLPYGLSNGFSRPHIFEINSIITIYPALENLLFIVLFVALFIFPRKLNSNQQLIIFSLGTFIVITYIFLGLLVPVLGNLVRYKAPLLPLLFFCLLTMIDKSKALNFYHKYRRK